MAWWLGLDSKSRGASTPRRGACPEQIEGIPTSGTSKKPHLKREAFFIARHPE